MSEGIHSSAEGSQDGTFTPRPQKYHGLVFPSLTKFWLWEGQVMEESKYLQ
jgi:hypothetical protein